MERFEDPDAGLDLLDRVGGQRHPDGVADALGEQRAEAHRGLDRAGLDRPGLGDAQVQRVVAGFGQQAVGLDHRPGVGVLDGDGDVGEVDGLKDPGFVERGFDQGGGRHATVLGQQALLQRPAVDPDADRDPGVACGVPDDLDLGGVPGLVDVAGVDADLGDARLDGGHRVLPLEVDVADDGDGGLLGDGGEGIGILLPRHRDPDDVDAGGVHRGDLLQRGVDVVGRRRGHRLHADRRATADLHPADVDLAGVAPRGRLVVLGHGRGAGQDGEGRGHGDPTVPIGAIRGPRLGMNTCCPQPGPPRRGRRPSSSPTLRR